MKKLSLVFVGIAVFFITNANAQVSVNVNIGTAPAWGPVGYTEAEYYYLPDVESYYAVREKRFIYFGNGRWTRSRHLPVRYSNYNLYNGYKVVLNDYHGHSPYVHYNTHKVKYYRGYHGTPQRTIGVRPSYRKAHHSPQHYNHNNGHHNGPGKGHGRGNHGQQHGRGNHR